MKKSISRSFKTFSGLVAILLILSTFSCKKAINTATDRIIEKQIEVLNKKCPIDVGEYMRIDSIDIEKRPYIAVFYCTLLYENFEESSFAQFEQQYKPIFVDGFLQSSIIKTLVPLGISYRYIFYNTEGGLLGKFDITKEDLEAAQETPSLPDFTDDCPNIRLDSIIDNMVSNYKKRVPEYINSNMRIDSATAEGENTFVMYSTLIYADWSKFDCEAYIENAKELCIYDVQTKDLYNVVRRKGICYKYVYFKDTGNYLGEFYVTPNDYKTALKRKPVSSNAYLNE